jgi:hypothetical protein
MYVMNEPRDWTLRDKFLFSIIYDFIKLTAKRKLIFKHFMKNKLFLANSKNLNDLRIRLFAYM